MKLQKNNENNLVEYKRELTTAFERSVVAFLNSNTGGHIYIGINNDGSMHGVKEADLVQRQITDRILNNIKPTVIGLFEVVVEQQEEKDIVHVIVSGGTEKPLVDPVALREAVINAIVHNDYTREVPPLFEIFSDRMEITTYGGLVEGLSKDDFLKCCSMPRNRELMRVFHDLDMVEQLGSGMRRILKSYDANAFSFTDHFMRISFYFDGIPSRLGDKLGDKLGSHPVELNYNRRRILEIMEANSRISIPQIAEKLGYSTTAIEKNIEYLKEKNYLRRCGNPKTGYWEVL